MSELWKKNRWLGRSIPGEDEAIMSALLEALPETDALDQDGEARMETARKLMAELFARGVSVQAFTKETGITGFPVDAAQDGLRKQKLMNASLCYYDLWLADKDPSLSVAAIRNVLLARKERAGEYAGAMTLQLFVDIDTDDRAYPYPFDVGLTPAAICMEFNMADVEANFAAIEAAIRKTSVQAISQVRIGLGTFGPDEYVGLSNGNMFTKRMPAAMGTEWIMFKNIHRRAGKFGWFWRYLAKRLDRKEEAKIKADREENERMQEQFRSEQIENQPQG